eukprot:GILJ01011599.1.p1 GENE.GILJ01011599.1~~GILJ01011599.1.p1  ORF type:complete len:244 (-),score=6.87 GILJ01011599.1:872-1510(-)
MTERRTPLLKWCHHCRAKRYGSECENREAPAKSGVRACKKMFCATCLKRYYEEPIYAVMDNVEWHYPFCRNECKCSKCNKGKQNVSSTCLQTATSLSAASSSSNATTSSEHSGRTSVVGKSNQLRQDADLEALIIGSKRCISQVGQQLERIVDTIGVHKVRKISIELQTLEAIFTELDVCIHRHVSDTGESSVPLFGRSSTSSVMRIENLLN